MPTAPVPDAPQPLSIAELLFTANRRLRTASNAYGEAVDQGDADAAEANLRRAALDYAAVELAIRYQAQNIRVGIDDSILARVEGRE